MKSKIIIIRQLDTGKAFTSIELLTVIAIFAILAVIAVPNFMEAQSRKMTAQSLSNLQAIESAIGAYRVDNGGALPGLNSMQAGWAYRYRFDISLSTPVPYMSSVPQDPYRQAGLIGPISFGTIYYYSYGLIDHNIVHALLHDPVGQAPGMWSPVDPNAMYFDRTIRDWVKYYYEPLFHNWNHGQASFMLHGVGPKWDTLSNSPYDPTNGTISAGDINYYH